MRGVGVTKLLDATRVTGKISIEGGPRFKEGQILSGKVIGSQGGKYLIQIGNKRVLADSRLRLQVGDAFKVRVAGTIDGQLHLKLLTLDRKFIFYNISDEEVMARLLAMKLPQSDSYINLAKVAIKYGIPLSRDILITLAKLLGKNFSSAKAEAAAFLLASGLETNQYNLTVLEGFVKGNLLLANYLAFIIAYYRKEVLPKELKVELHEMIHQLSKLILKGDLPERMANSLRRGRPDTQNLSELMSRVSSELRSFPQHEPLRYAVETVRDVLEGCKLINSVNNDENYYYLLIPANLAGKPVTFELKVFYYRDETGNRLIDPEHYRFELSVESETLGKLTFKVTVKGRDTIVWTSAEEQSVVELLDSKHDLLRNALERVGYRLTEFRAGIEQRKGNLMQHYELEGMDIVV